ncbi:hypothetical protein HRI96_05115 [Treponema parvum]|uniref:PilZ domain-containing protein n=1 Tax=Treponema parvum TaxID=138851 RepID=A0A975ICC3_9SPIR|nr:hypothetical protein [Treponema parvum]QTQ11637.1 hypothetical protein HRI96_05115 [Treponema parvum]
MNNWAAVPGSPLLARQNVTQWAGVIFLGLAVIGLLLLLAVLLRILKRHSSPEWASKQQNAPTKLKNVNAVVLKYDLSKDEKNLLWDMCRVQAAPNIEYLIHSPEKLTDLFKKHYSYLKEKKAGEKEIALLYILIYKLEQAYVISREIKSSKNIPDGVELVYIDDHKRKFLLKLVNHDKDALYVQVPPLFKDQEARPKELQKIKIMFMLQGNAQYEMHARIIRYQTTTDGTFQMLLTHSNDLTRLARRGTKRLSFNRDCYFSSVKVEAKNNGKSGEILYIPDEKRIQGFLTNISAEGCAMSAAVAVEKDQYIGLEIGEINSFKIERVIGLVRDVEKAPDRAVFTLHIKFIKIALKDQNRICAYIYNFNT